MTEMVDPSDNTNTHNQFLNDIMMSVTVEVGRAKLKISELMDLKEGSVVPLEQSIDEPLTIYVNDKVVAKGQIISVDGKYNIRIL